MQHFVNVNTSYKNVDVFFQWSLYPSGYNNFYHRFPKLRSNTCIEQFVDDVELVILENLDSEKRQKRVSLFFLSEFSL